MYCRAVNPLKTRSFFLFGARGTGKTSFLREFFADARTLWIDLLSDSEFLAFGRAPALLEERIKAQVVKTGQAPEWIVIDEVQRVPKLLNEVHRLVEDRKFQPKLRFALTGSSARKLKRGGANMLGGRALLNNLFPLTFLELGGDFNLETALRWGSLPEIWTAPDDITRAEALKSYYHTYLREEIREEQLVRQLDPFTRFIEVAAQVSGKIVNFSAIGREAGIHGGAVQRYFEILEDTLLGVFLPAFHRSVRKQQTMSPKFYLFDLGVQRAIQNSVSAPLTAQSYDFGNLFEQFIILECVRLNSYLRKDFRLSYLRTKDDAEIDLIVERPGKKPLLVEIKSSENVDAVEVRKLARFLDDPAFDKGLFLSRDAQPRVLHDIPIFPWQQGLRHIFEIPD